MAYIGQEPGQGTAQRSIFTAVAVTDTVTADDNSLPLNYTVGQVSVYLNGVKQVVGDDVVASNGSTLVFASDYAIGDVIEVIALDTFSVGTVEGTALISTGESGGSKFLREDGDGTSSWQTVPVPAVYNDDVIQTNLAILAFRTATNASGFQFNLQDQVIDEYGNTDGVDGTPSNNHVLAGGAYRGEAVVTPTVTHDADATDTLSGYTWYKWTTAGTETYQTNTAQDYDYLVVAGGGGGGSMGAGGAGGFRTATGLAVAASTDIAVTVGAGGSGVDGRGSNGGNSVFGSITSTGGGGGGAFSTSVGEGADGGSGGGGGSSASAPYSGRLGGAGIEDGGALGTLTHQGSDGGTGYTGANSGAGGGGADTAGANGTHQTGGAGGAGENEVMGMDATASDAFLTTGAVDAGVDAGDGYRYFSGGGGGTGSATRGLGGNGGGGNGKVSSTAATVGTDGTGGGGGAGYTSIGADGGDGIVIIRHLSTVTTISDLTLQSTDTTAEAQPDFADMVMLIEDAAGTATVGGGSPDIKGFISRDSGTTFTEGTLVDEGDWGTNKRILAFHDLDIDSASQPDGTAMCYKITTHNQSASKETKIHATSIGWR